jgi:hypothetical protein
MFLRRPLYTLKLWGIYQLDKFVTWTPAVQVPILVLLTGALVVGWASILWLLFPEPASGDAFWWALSRFADAGTMAGDRGGLLRMVALGVTSSGVLLLSFLTGAFASKLSERIGDVRSGRSPVVERDHLLILGFDAKVPLIARELARSHQRLTLVTLSEEDKVRQEILLRAATRLRRSSVRFVARTGDARAELALLRVSADRARTIVVVARPQLTDEAAVKWTQSTLLALRRVAGPEFSGRIIVDARRAAHGSLLALAADAGLAGPSRLPLQIVASDDVMARVLAQSVRHGAVHLALRELLSFRGSEFYLEDVPPALLGSTFERAHRAIWGAVAVGVLRRDGARSLAPPREERPLEPGDRLILLERESGDFTIGPELPPVELSSADGTSESSFPRTVAILGYNRSLAALISELDRVMQPGSRLKLSHPALTGAEEEEVRSAAQGCRRVDVERFSRPLRDMANPSDAALQGAEGVVILGCEDEHDPDGDASAVSHLLQLRRAGRVGGPRFVRLVTEVRDPTTARQIGGTLDDFLVSTDVVAMMLAQAALNPELGWLYREIMEPGGAELFIRPLAYCAREESATFARVMAGARARGEFAIGYLSEDAASHPATARREIEIGDDEAGGFAPVHLNPRRETGIPPGSRIIVLSRQAP